MSDFRLLNSLINPPAAPIVEEAPAAPGPSISIEDVDQLSAPRSSGQWEVVPCSLWVSYTEPGLEGVAFAVNATLQGEFRQEDDSFDHAFGTHGGKYYVFDNLSFVNVTVKHSEENYELYKLPSEQVSRAIALAHKYIGELGEDEIAELVDAEKIAQMLERNVDNFNEPDDAY